LGKPNSSTIAPHSAVVGDAVANQDALAHFVRAHNAAPAPTWAGGVAEMVGNVLHGENRTTMMPVRKRSRAKAREDRVKSERRLSDAYVAERRKPPPF
jgi:hypothetical protein